VSAVSLSTEERIYIVDKGNSRILLLKIPVTSDTGPQITWQAMKQFLVAGNTTGALTYFATASRDSYREQFALLGSQKIAQAVAEIGQIFPVSIASDTAQYRFVNSIRGVEFTFYIRFVKENGKWRVLEY
jgi:hypothetical protein